MCRHFVDSVFEEEYSNRVFSYFPSYALYTVVLFLYMCCFGVWFQGPADVSRFSSSHFTLRALPEVTEIPELSPTTHALDRTKKN